MKINIDFAFILTMLVLLSGLISLVDVIFFAHKRKLKGKEKKPVLVEYARSFFPLLLVIWLLRSFLIQPYRVPSGSLAPTILPGDFIAVNQFSYGLRVPVINYKLVSIGDPKHGDIALFRWPVNPAVVFIKRVVGLPGDHVVYRNKVLTINGVVASQELVGRSLDVEPPYDIPLPVQEKIENLLGVKHHIFVHDEQGRIDNFDVTIPAGLYFMMGDNRDASDDSRMWGFVPDANLIGKAMVTWFSWNGENHEVRWNRIGKLVR